MLDYCFDLIYKTPGKRKHSFNGFPVIIIKIIVVSFVSFFKQVGEMLCNLPVNNPCFNEVLCAGAILL